MVASDRPTGAELLAEARRTLLEELLGLLPAERRYDGLMIANAIAIAARELQAGDAPAAGRLAMLRRIDATAGEGGDRPNEGLADLERRLAAGIRAGAYDSPGCGRDAVRAYLRRAVLERLAISNPKALPNSRRE